jgi:secreted protein with Ig-like and vWFA domain
MKHNETNSESDPKPGTPAALDPTLEARVVAWVAGEASPFEREELERLVAAQPELAIFKRRIEAVQGLVGEAARPDRTPLRMSAERRAKLLQAIGATDHGAAADPGKVVTLPPAKARSRWSWRGRQIYFTLAGAAAAGLVVLLVLPVREDKYRMKSAIAKAVAEAPALPGESPKDAEQARLPAPASVTLSAGGAGGRIAGSDNELAAGAAAPVPPRAERTVVLDAFTVATSREGRVAAAATGAGSASAANKPDATTTTFADDLKTSFTKKDAVGPDGRVAASSGVVLGSSSGPVSPVTQSESSRASAPALSKPKEERANLAAEGDVGKQTTGAKVEGKGVGTDLPLARPTSLDTDRGEALRAEIAASAQPESTFSLHVSDVSFRLAQAALARGELPDADRIRPEEFYNAFNYGDPVPTMVEKVGARIEQSAHPFLQQRNFVRIALKVPATGRGAAQPLRLTVLLDTSGSMEREDRAATVRRALQELIALLGPNDRVTLVGFARQPRLLAEAVAGNEAGSLVELAARTPAEGGTNLEAALKLGGELARRHALAGAQNRIVVLTDGAANLGDADPEQLARNIEALRQQGIAFDACGIGLDGLDDAVLEALTRRGDGRYHVLNSPEEAGAGFARQLAGAFRPAAENVKLQVRFNAARVGRYRLIGFEQHRLRSEDFRNDRVDAAELAAEEAAVALYQVEVLPAGSGELGEVAVRFRDAATGQMVERTWAIPHEAAAPAFDRATRSMQLAGTAALLAEKLRGGAPAEPIKLKDLAPVVNALRGTYANEPRVQEFATMFAQARRRFGE